MARANQPQQPPPPETPPVVLDKFSGLKNTVEPERLTAEEFEYAVNIDLDDVGQVHRRRGKTLVASGAYGSLYTTDEGVVFATKDGAFGILNRDYSFRTLDNGYPAHDQLAYVQVGPTLYFSSRTRAGKVDLQSFQVGPWGSTPDLWLSPVLNPTATLPPIRGRLLGAPPLATTLAAWNGRIYMGSGREVWATELYLYDFVDRTKNFWQFEAEITMIGTVTDGIYVGTSEGVWFISGMYNEAKRVRVMDSGVIPGSMVYAPSELANPGTIQVPVGQRQETDQKVSILFLTQNGYCGGQDGGVCFNYSEDKFVFPDALRAASVWRRQDGLNQYLAVLQSGGTPSASTRIGDFVDATLVRGGGRWDTVGEGIRLGDSVTVVKV